MKITLLISILLVFGHAHAHDLWLEKSDGDYALYSGHKHSGHEGDELIQYSPEIVLQAKCFDDRGNPVEVKKTSIYPVHVTSDCSTIYVFTSSGYWTKTPYGTKNIPKSESPSAIKSWLSYESVKYINGWSSEMVKPLTSDLELVPLNNPLSVDVGKKLRLLVTFDGKPVKKAIVSYDGKPRGETGKDGRINVRLHHDGFQVIQASYTRPIESEKADQVVYTTNLNFELDTEQ